MASSGAITAAAGEILEQHRRARSPAGETINRPGTWLWWLLDGPTNAGRLRGDGDDQERAGSEHQRRRHQGPGSLHRWTVPGGRLSRHLILSRMTRDQRSVFATEPLVVDALFMRASDDPVGHDHGLGSRLGDEGQHFFRNSVIGADV